MLGPVMTTKLLSADAYCIMHRIASFHYGTSRDNFASTIHLTDLTDLIGSSSPHDIVTQPAPIAYFEKPTLNITELQKIMI